MRITLKRGNDQVVTMTNLRTNAQPPVYLNSAVAKATLLDSKGQVVQPFNDVVMPYVPASNGNYEWTIEGNTMMIPKNVEYSLVITALQGGLDYRVVHQVSVVDGD